MAISVTHATTATLPDDPTAEINKDEWNAAHVVSGAPEILAVSFASVVAPADTAENILATVNIPALGVGDAVRCVFLVTFTNNSNLKTPRIRLGGIGGTDFGPLSNWNTHQYLRWEIWFGNNGATNAQNGWGSGNTGDSSFRHRGPITATIDTSVATTLVITMQKATGTDTATLIGYEAELYRA